MALLARELGDPAVARAYAELFVADVLQWKPPLVEPKEVKTIVAYTFGNRIDRNGNRSLGPRQRGARRHCRPAARGDGRTWIYAQWEIAEAIGNRVRVAAPRLDHASQKRSFEPVYLSTGGVAAAVVNKRAIPDGLAR